MVNNNEAPSPEAQLPSKNGDRSKTIGAWMIIAGFSLAGFSINDYFAKHPLDTVSKAPLTKEVSQQLSEQVFPLDGYTVNAKWGDIGPNLIKSGVIDSDKFKSLYSSGGGLKTEELEILEQGSDTNIKITKENSHFVLNMLWAFGLGQKNDLLTHGDMTSHGGHDRFASTGGWTISSKPLDEFYSKFDWLNLSLDQETAIKNIASNVYRPCCNNSTAFPDCNHGMAALGLVEIMVANENSEEEIYDALKYFNSFWFSSSYLETAIYFKEIKGIEWTAVDAKTILSKEYSSASGWKKNIHQELAKYPELVPETAGGGGCGI